MSARIDAVSARVQTAVTMSQVYREDGQEGGRMGVVGGKAGEGKEE